LSEHFLTIGACGWDYPQWNDDFYPDDLPDEWRLGFYGNEFPVVLIPAQAWQQGVAAVRAWLDETHDAPDFICEWPASETRVGEYEQVLEMISLLRTRVLAIVVPLDEPADGRLLRYLQQLEQLAPLALDVSAQADPQSMADAVQAHLRKPVSMVWHGEPQTQALLARGELAIARINQTQEQPRTMRAIIEALLGCAQGKARLLLLIDGQPPSLRQLRAAGVIQDLL